MHVVVGAPRVASNTRTTKMRLQEKKENDTKIYIIIENYKIFIYRLAIQRSREQSITLKHTGAPFPSNVTDACQGATQKNKVLRGQRKASTKRGEQRWIERGRGETRACASILRGTANSGSDQKQVARSQICTCVP